MSKCEIADIGVLKEMSMELCGMECIDLIENSVKILGIQTLLNLLKKSRMFSKFGEQET